MVESMGRVISAVITFGILLLLLLGFVVHMMIEAFYEGRRCAAPPGFSKRMEDAWMHRYYPRLSILYRYRRLVSVSTVCGVTVILVFVFRPFIV